MSDNLIAPAAHDGADTGETLRLTSLAPKFDAESHKVYFDLLVRAIAHEDTRNVALTGAYGTGKSSVLSHLLESAEYSERIVGLSLSTVAPRDRETQAPQPADESPTSRVNQIQKEIVKQLLYRTPVRKVPQSRFRRATVPKRAGDFWLAVVVGLVVAVVLFLLGPLHPLITSWFSETWRHVLAYGIAATAIVGLTWALIVAIRVRPLMSASVNAAITTVTLTKQSDTYFDAYLDEIVYFFEATEKDIVVIEDLDRFEDVQVFDTLRSLNGLLNNSGQIGRRIVFIYAIRDSVFEEIGSPDLPEEPTHALSDHAKQALKRASRTKFFDIIIPVVPFVSPDNARDVMSTAMKSKAYKIDPGLIRLAARHVADMRLIHNIRNEFEIYRNELVVPEMALPDITDDLVFAIVLFKNTHLADYESIRHRDSALDHLYVAWRAAVRSGIATRATALSDLRSREALSSQNDRAADLGERLLRLRDDLDAAIPAPYALSLAEDEEETLDSPETWARIVEEDSLQLSLTRGGSTATTFTFSAEALARMLGADVDPSSWAQADAEAAAREESDLLAEISFLRHHTWAELHARTDITFPKSLFSFTDDELRRLETLNEGDEVNFAHIVSATLPSELARELVRHEYLTSHFALYASKYYGKHLSANAREYIYRCIGPGEPDTTFPLSRKEIRQILREQHADRRDDADLFSDKSVLNVNIVDFLLSERPGAAATVAAQLASMGDGRREFLDAYVAQGREPGMLLGHLAPRWSGSVEYAVSSEAVPPDKRVGIVNSALQTLNGPAVTGSAAFARLVELNYGSMTALTEPADAESAAAVLRLVGASGGTIFDLAPLNPVAREAALSLGLFPVTEANVRAIVPSGKVVLAGIRRTNKQLYRHLSQHISDYLQLVKVKPAAFAVAGDSAQATNLLNDFSEAGDETLRSLLDACPPDVRIDDLASVPRETWATIAAARRTLPTFVNVEAYIAYAGVDGSLAALLKARRIVTPQAADRAARCEVAYAILAASDAIPSTLARTQTVLSMNTGVLDPTLVEGESGDLVARLIKAQLLPDDATSFTTMLLPDWESMERAIKVSKNFKTFVAPDVLPVAWLPQFIQSTQVSKDERLAVIHTLESYLTSATVAQAREVATALIRGGWRIQTSRILALLSAGARSSQIIVLAANWGNDIGLEQVKKILRALGGDYARVADGGSGRPNFPTDASHRTILERFVGDTVRRVKEDHFKRSGFRLVASLK